MNERLLETQASQRCTMMPRMGESARVQHDAGRRPPVWAGRRLGRFARILLVVAIAGFAGGRAAAQETPEPTPGATHAAQETPARIRVVVPEGSVDVGDEFEVQVLAENVENLASFDFAISFDPGLMSFLRANDIGELLATGERQMICSDPMVRERTLFISCITPGPPFCLGGEAGASGSGLLARVVFRAEQEGSSRLELTDPTDLLLDDLDPCDPNIGRAVEIPFRRGPEVSVELGGGGGGISGALIGVIVGIVAVVLVGAAGGLLWYRRRGAASL